MAGDKPAKSMAIAYSAVEEQDQAHSDEDLQDLPQSFSRSASMRTLTRGEQQSLFEVLRWPSGISQYHPRGSSASSIISPVSSVAHNEENVRSARSLRSHPSSISSVNRTQDAQQFDADTITALPSFNRNGHSDPSQDQPHAASRFEENIGEGGSKEVFARASSFPTNSSDRQPRPRGASNLASQQSLWNSPWLRTQTLVGFALLFLIIFVVTLALYGVSRRDHGIDSRSWSSHYGWTLGPTLISVVILALWRQVDLDCRILAPWEDMRQGSSPAARSLLLDYTSEFTPVVLYQAIRNHHWAVVFSAFGYVILIFMTILSTGLFVLEPTQTSRGFVNRVHVKQLTVAFMATTSALMVITSGWLCLFRPWNAVSRNPNTIMAIASFLASSPSFKGRLAGLSTANSEEFQDALRQDSHRTKIVDRNGPSFEVFATETLSKEARKPNARSSLVWWHPNSFRPLSAIAVVLSPLIMISILEGVQRVSDKNGGIIDAGDWLGHEHVFATFIPAFVMLLISHLFTTLDSDISIMAPFLALKRGTKHAQSALFVEIVGRLPHKALLDAFKARHISRVLSILSILLASWLSIVVSSLYSPQYIPGITNASSIQMADTFSLSLNGSISVDDRGAGERTARLITDNSTFPQWTYGNLAFPILRSDGSSKRSTTSRKTDAQIPATRGVLNCTKISSRNTSIDTSAIPTVLINTSLPWMCDSESPSTSPHWIQQFWFNYPPEGGEMLFGHVDQMSWNASGTVTSTGMDVDMYYEPTSGCPSIAITFGKADFRPDSVTGETQVAVTDLNMAVCYEHIETLMTEVIIDLDTFEIDTSTNRPVEQEASVIRLETDAIPPSQKFGFPINTLLSNLEFSNQTTPDLSNQPISPFLRALEWRTGGSPLSSFLGESNADRLITAVSDVFALFIAQLLNANARVPWMPHFAPPSSTYAQNGKLRGIERDAIRSSSAGVPSQNILIAGSETSRLRLVQNKGPKIALQVILALLSAIAIFIYTLTWKDIRTLLPRSPTSIAGLGSLLAESKFVDRTYIPHGTEWDSNARTSRDAVLNNLTFTLGWRESDMSRSTQDEDYHTTSETDAIQGRSPKPNRFFPFPTLPNLPPMAPLNLFRGRSHRSSHRSNSSEGNAASPLLLPTSNPNPDTPPSNPTVPALGEEPSSTPALSHLAPPPDLAHSPPRSMRLSLFPTNTGYASVATAPTDRFEPRAAYVVRPLRAPMEQDTGHTPPSHTVKTETINPQDSNASNDEREDVFNANIARRNMWYGIDIKTTQGQV